MLTRTVAILIAAAGVSLAATQSHAEPGMGLVDKYIGKLKSSGKFSNFDLDKLRSEGKIGRFDLSKFKSDTKVGGYDLSQLSSSGFWQKSDTTAGLPRSSGALASKAKKTSSLSSKASSYASRIGK